MERFIGFDPCGESYHLLEIHEDGMPRGYVCVGYEKHSPVLWVGRIYGKLLAFHSLLRLLESLASLKGCTTIACRIDSVEGLMLANRAGFIHVENARWEREVTNGKPSAVR